jgi:glucose dehydrogenase
MRAITWLILVLAAAAAIYWYGFYESQSVTTEVVSEAMVPVPAPVALGQVDDARVANAADDDGNWLTHGRTFDEQRFSPLTQINRETISGLGLAWFRDMGTKRTPSPP